MTKAILGGVLVLAATALACSRAPDQGGTGLSATPDEKAAKGQGHAEHGEKGHAEHGEKGHAEHGEQGHDEHGEKGHAEHGEHGEKGHAEHDEKGHAEHDEKGHAEHGEKGHAERGEKGHDEHGEKGHDEHGEKGHDEHGEKGHDEHGEKGHVEEEEGHEEGVVELTPEAAARVTITTAPVEERDLAGELATTAEVGFDQDHLVHVSPRLPGRVHEVKVTLGQMVKAGDVIAVIDSTELGRAKADYLQARARQTLAAENLAREEKLVAQQISAQRDVATARADASEARSALYAATQALQLYGLSSRDIGAIRQGQADAALYPVRTPMDGKVVEKHANRGELVQSEERMFIVADLSRVWVSIDLYERDLARVHVDDLADIRVDAFPDRTFRGRISYVGDQIDLGTRTAQARIEVENKDGALRPGMFARVRLTDPHAAPAPDRPKSLVVPASAVQRAGEGFLAFVKTGERRYERRTLRIGRRTSDYVEVVEGVRAGEPVVTQGTFILKSEAAKESMGGGHSH